VRLLEDTLARADGAGEGSALVPEELRLDEVGRHSGAVEDHEGACRARSLVVEGLREHLLAGAGLPSMMTVTVDWARRSQRG